MAKVGLKEASRLTGKNQSTIHRAMKTGKLSFTVNDSGERIIDTSELNRVFQVNPEGTPARNDNEGLQSNLAEIAKLRMQLEAERTQMALYKERLTEKNDNIADLRLDRDKWRNQAEKLLITDQRVKKNQGWWLFGKKRAGWRGRNNREKTRSPGG